MKRVLFVVAMMMSQRLYAESLLSIPGLSSAVADALKSSKAVGLVDVNGLVAGGAFVPLRTLHDGQGINYLQAGIGGAIKQTEHLKPLVIVDGDISAIWRRAEGYSSWYQDHVTAFKLPDFWLGPYIAVPMPGEVWTWKSSLGGSISVGF